MSEWGNPISVIADYRITERTEGSETSQYLEEEKSNEISQVAVSERDIGQTKCLHLGL